MKKTETAGGVVVNTLGQILVVSQHGNSWSLPKGHIETGEDPLAAARREIHEESGVGKLALKKPLGTYNRYRIGLDGFDDKSELKTMHMFLFTTSQMELAPIDPHNPVAQWVAVDAVADLLTHPRDKQFFRELIDKGEL